MGTVDIRYTAKQLGLSKPVFYGMIQCVRTLKRPPCGDCPLSAYCADAVPLWRK
jgi:hypothetical protein